MQKLLNRSHTNVHTIAYILGGVSVFGYLISFLRDRAFAHYFGASELLDIYVASFRIPDILFIATTAFISVYALLPMFEEKMRKSDKELQEFVNTTFYFIVLFLVIGGVILFFATPFLGRTLFGGFQGESFDTFVLFSRVFLVQASLFAISSFFTAILQLKRKFLLYSLLPILYNAGIIFGVIVLYPRIGTVGLAFGVLLGVLVNVVIQIPVMLQNNILPLLAPTRRTVRECWRAIKMSIPRASALLSQGVTQIFIFSAMISISEGALSIYYFAENIKAVPLVIIGTAYSVATFPLLVSHFVENNMNAFRSVVEEALRRLLFFILPIIAFVFVLREPLVSMVFETGFFTAKTVAITSTIVAAFILSALTTSILTICARALYACKKSVVSFVILFTLSAAKIALVYATVRFTQHNEAVLATVQRMAGLESSEHSMLFAATLIIVALEVIASVAILIILLRNIKQKIMPLYTALMQNSAATAALITTVIVMKKVFFGGAQYNSIEGVFIIACMGLAGMVCWYATLRLVKNKESEMIKEKIEEIVKKIIKKTWKT